MAAKPGIEAILRILEDREGSDLHLVEGRPVKIRVHGRLEEIQVEDVDVPHLVASLLDDRRRTLFEERGEVDLAFEAPDTGRYRVNAFRHHEGVGAVFRTIPLRIPGLEELRLPPQVESFAHVRRGLVLVTGPTGSGKSSTLAALLDRINDSESIHVVTIEDPVEFLHEDRMATFTQREVGTDCESFEDALSSAGRQDPDLVLVGEMRDRETIQLALTLAEMGMRVFSTLHTNSAGRTIDRIVEVFPEDQQPRIRSMLAQHLQGVLSQILCRTAGGDGRVPATELLLTSTALRSVIREGASHKIQSMLQAGRALGMHTMDDSIRKLLQAGTIEADEAYLKATDKAGFEPPGS